MNDDICRMLAEQGDRYTDEGHLYQMAERSVWQDHALRATGNTYRMLRDVLRTATRTDLTCVVVFPTFAHVQNAQNDLAHIADAMGHTLTRRAIADLDIHFTSLHNVEALLRAKPRAALFVDASCIPTLLQQRFFPG